MSNELELRAGFDRLRVNARGDSRRYLVAEVEAPSCVPERTRAREREPIHMALVIDRSGSMGGGRLEAAKEAALGVIDRLSATDRLSLVAFDDVIEVVVDGASMAEEGATAARQAIWNLLPRGTTDLFGAWLAGAECIARSVDGQSRVIVLSDGKANRGVTDPGEIGRHAAELYRRSIVTSTVGIGDAYEPRQLLALSEHGGGNLHDAMRPEEIIDMVAGELGESLNAYADRVDLELRTPHGVRVDCWSGYPLERTGDRWTFSLGSLPAGRKRTAIFALDLPAGETGSKLQFELVARWQRPGASAMQVGEIVDLSLEWVRPRDLVAQWRDVDRSMQVADVWQARIVRTATGRNLDGDFDGAQRFVEEQRRDFQRYVEGLPGAEDLARDLIRLRRRSGSGIGARLSKELMWQASSSQRSSRDYRRGGRASWKEQLDR